MGQLAEKLKVGDPTLPETEVGPLIRHREVERVALWVKEAVTAGANVVAGGLVLSPSCYSPTVLLDPPPDAKISTQEVFGPAVCVYAYDELDDAIERANSLPYAFQAAVFTRNYATAMYAYSRLDASAVMVNDHTGFFAYPRKKV